jgi:hypothetical protein
MEAPNPAVPPVVQPGRGGYLFRLIRILSSIQFIHEIVEPLFRFILDVLTAALLGITLCMQSVSLIISFDSVITGVYKSISRNLANGIVSLASFFISESERKALSTSLVNYSANLFWTYIAYKMSVENSRAFFYKPLIIFGVLNVLVNIFVTRNELIVLNTFWNRQMLYSLLISLSYLIVRQAKSVSRHSRPVMLLLLKTPINSLFSGLEFLFRFTLSQNGDDLIFIPPAAPVNPAAPNNNNNIGEGGVPTSVSNHGYAEYDNISNYVLEIMRLSLWTAISLYEYSICLNPTSGSIADSMEHFNLKRDRWFYLLLLFHDFINLSVPVKKLLMKITKDALIQQQFPRITEAELRNLPEDDRCAICLCDHNTSSVRLPCQHLLHAQCLNRVLQEGNRFNPSRCPICRSDILPAGNPLASGGALAAAAAGGGANEVLTHGDQSFELRDIIRVRIITPTTRFNGATNPVNLGNNNNNNNNIGVPPAANNGLNNFAQAVRRSVQMRNVLQNPLPANAGNDNNNNAGIRISFGFRGGDNGAIGSNVVNSGASVNPGTIPSVSTRSSSSQQQPETNISMQTEAAATVQNPQNMNSSSTTLPMATDIINNNTNDNNNPGNVQIIRFNVTNENLNAANGNINNNTDVLTDDTIQTILSIIEDFERTQQQPNPSVPMATPLNINPNPGPNSFITPVNPIFTADNHSENQQLNNVEPSNASFHANSVNSSALFTNSSFLQTPDQNNNSRSAPPLPLSEPVLGMESTEDEEKTDVMNSTEEIQEEKEENEEGEERIPGKSEKKRKRKNSTETKTSNSGNSSLPPSHSSSSSSLNLLNEINEGEDQKESTDEKERAEETEEGQSMKKRKTD